MAAKIFPYGTALTVIWHLTKPDGTDFGITGYTYRVYYRTGNKETEANGSHLTALGNTISIVIPATEPSAPGEYALRLVLYQNNKLFCTLNYNAAFVLSRRLAQDLATETQQEEMQVVHLWTVAEYYLFTPIIPTVGSDGYWYVNGTKVTDGHGEFVPSSHTMEYDAQTNYIIIDRDRVDSQGQSIAQTITSLADALSTAAEDHETAQEDHSTASDDHQTARADHSTATWDHQAIVDMIDLYEPITINGDVTNAPDEEDITSDENDLLKFKDRGVIYGMGYCILRRNKTFAEQVTKMNTIYEIRYNFDLEGESVTIPEGCVLNFVGGSLSNGTIIMDDTELCGAVRISASMSGTIKNYELFTSWFLNDLSLIGSLPLSGHKLSFTSDMEFSDPLVIENISDLVIDGCGRTITGDDTDSFIWLTGECSDIEVFNFICRGNTNAIFFGTTAGTSHYKGIKVHDNDLKTLRVAISFDAHTMTSEDTATFDSSEVYNNTIDLDNPSASVGNYGIHLANVTNCVVRNNKVSGCQRHAIYHSYGQDNIIQGNVIENNGWVTPTGTSFIHVARCSKNVLIADNIFKNNDGIDLTVQGLNFDEHVLIEKDTVADNVTITGNVFQNLKNVTATMSCIQVGLPNQTTKNVVINNNDFVIKGYNTHISNINKVKYPFVIYDVDSCSITNNTFSLLATDNESHVNATILYIPSQIDLTKTKFTFSNNQIYITKKCLGGSVFNATNVSSVSIGLLSNIEFKDNVFRNQRGASSVNYDIYSSNIANLLSGLSNFQPITETMEISADTFDTAVGLGKYAIVGDMIVMVNTGRVYRCTVAGNPGTWRINTMAGNTASRPKGIAAEGGTLVPNVDLYTEYFDTDVRKTIRAIYINPTSGAVSWRDGSGLNVNVRRSGSTAYRPVGSDIEIGFWYFDTELTKPVFAAAINGDTVTWVDANGETV